MKDPGELVINLSRRLLVRLEASSFGEIDLQVKGLDINHSTSFRSWGQADFVHAMCHTDLHLAGHIHNVQGQ
jgi:hypothetical protein